MTLRSALTFRVIRTAALTLLCSLQRLFWNQTLMTREFKPVISTNCSYRKITIKFWTGCAFSMLNRTLSSASGFGLCWKQAVKMVRCFSVRTVLPLLDRPLPGPIPLFETRMLSISDFGSNKSGRSRDRLSEFFPLSSWFEKSLDPLPDGEH